MATRHHQPTEAPLRGFEARLQAGFEWLASRPREVLGALLVLVISGAVGALAYEWVTRAESDAQEALARAERNLARALGGNTRAVLIPEPANAEQALAIRLEALESLVALIDEHGGTRAAELGSLRAAELEIDVKRHDSAEARLRRLVADLDTGDPLRAMALRLLAYVHTEAGRYLEAAEAQAAAAEVGSYPDVGVMWADAGRNFERAGALERAMRAYDRALAADPQFAEQNRLVERIVALEGRMPLPSASPVPASEAPAAGEAAAGAAAPGPDGVPLSGETPDEGVAPAD